ncbi:12575_t:CDS:1, partial [Gigaspora margarita]
GQTGVDRGTLDAALDHEETMRNLDPKAMQNITITGWCPKGRRSEDGPIDKEYPLKETNTNEYNQRTEMNVKDAEATLILLLNNNKDKGTEYTIKMTYEYNKRLNIINLDMNNMNDNIENTVGWIITNLIRHLNVAGSRESNCPTIHEKTYKFIRCLLRRLETRGVI